MRMRPIGPGIGGLNYEPLLRDSINAAPSGARSANAHGAAFVATVAPRITSLRQTLASWARTFGERFVEARMQQAQDYVARATRIHALDQRARFVRGNTTWVRYY